MPTSYRRERANGFIREEVTLLLRDAVRDPRAHLLTVTDVDLTPDRRIARIYVACYGNEEDLQEGLKGLESAKGFLRRRLSQLLRWHFVPDIEFRVDRSWERGAKIDSLLKKLGDDHPNSTERDQ